jgi:DNA-binding transcriptional MerR regulator
VYRRADVEQVARIRHLLLVEGLTLAGARRRIDDEATLVAADEPLIDELVGENARQRLTEVKRGLQSILELLAAGQGGDDFRLAAPIHSRPAPNGRSAAPAAKLSKGRRAAPARRRRA